MKDGLSLSPSAEGTKEGRSLLFLTGTKDGDKVESIDGRLVSPSLEGLNEGLSLSPAAVGANEGRSLLFLTGANEGMDDSLGPSNGTNEGVGDESITGLVVSPSADGLNDGLSLSPSAEGTKEGRSL